MDNSHRQSLTWLFTWSRVYVFESDTPSDMRNSLSLFLDIKRTNSQGCVFNRSFSENLVITFNALQRRKVRTYPYVILRQKTFTSWYTNLFIVEFIELLQSNVIQIGFRIRLRLTSSQFVSLRALWGWIIKNSNTPHHLSLVCPSTKHFDATNAIRTKGATSLQLPGIEKWCPAHLFIQDFGQA